MRLGLPILSALGLAVFASGAPATSGKSTSDPAKPEFINIPIDHNDSSAGTFRNKYYVNDLHYAPGGPIFLWDSGETPASARLQRVFLNQTHFFNKLLEEFHGMGIEWENRYYGDSKPFPVTSDPDPEHIKYQTFAQALADIPYFAKHFKRDNFQDVELTPDGTPWVMLGSSYSGMRSAFARNKYPETIFAAFSSSGIVQAQADLSSYHDQVARGMVAKGFGGCVKDLQAAMKYIDDQLSSDDTAASVKQKFLGPAAGNNTNGDFAKVLSYIYAQFQVQSMHGILGEICRHLETDPDTNKTAGPDGLAPTHGDKYVTEKLASAAKEQLINTVELMHQTRCDETQCDLTTQYAHPDYVPWFWQTCTELGFFNTNKKGPLSLNSKYLTVENDLNICRRNFPTAIKRGAFPSQPQVDAFNAEYGGWTVRPSNVYWSVGEWDPWKPTTVFSNDDSAPKGVSFTTEIPACGVSTGDDTVFGYVLEGQEHGFDITDDNPSPAIRDSQDHFRSALREWLPCFKPKGPRGSA